MYVVDSTSKEARSHTDDRSAMLAVPEAANYAGVSRKSIYRAIADGRLKAARLCRGNRLQIRRSWIDDWIDASVVTPEASGQYALFTERRQPRRGILKP